MSEARTSQRAPAAFEVRTKSASDGEFTEQQARDISAGGVFLCHAEPLKPGTLLRLEFRLPKEDADGSFSTEEASSAHGVGRVVWVRSGRNASEAAPAGMGVKFVRIDDDSLALVERYVVQNGPEITSNLRSDGKPEPDDTPTGNTESSPGRVSFETLPEEESELQESASRGGEDEVADEPSAPMASAPDAAPTPSDTEDAPQQADSDDTSAPAHSSDPAPDAALSQPPPESKHETEATPSESGPPFDRSEPQATVPTSDPAPAAVQAGMPSDAPVAPVQATSAEPAARRSKPAPSRPSNAGDGRRSKGKKQRKEEARARKRAKASEAAEARKSITSASVADSNRGRHSITEPAKPPAQSEGSSLTTMILLVVLIVLAAVTYVLVF